MASPRIDICCASNIYIRQMDFQKAGDVEEGHKHPYNHFTYLAAGALILEIPENNIRVAYEAPAMIFIEKDKIHRLTATQDNTRAACIHALRDADAGDDIIPFESLPINHRGREIPEYMLRALVRK